MTPVTLREAAALIESLTAERDALAEQVRVMREALEWSKVHVEHVADLDTRPHQVDWEASVALRLLEVALALAPNAAEQRAKENAEAAAQVPGLVEQLRVMREALEFIDATEHEYPIEYEMDTGAELAATYAWGNAIIECRDAMTLTPTAAETQAKANAEKAAEYDKMTLQVLVANADRDRFMSKAEANEEAAQAFDRLAEACGVETSEGGHGFPIADVLQAALENLAHRRGEAKANAEKAGLLDWLDHTRPSLSFGCSPEYPLGAWGIFWTNKQTKQVEEAEAERLPDALRAAREASDD